VARGGGRLSLTDDPKRAPLSGWGPYSSSRVPHAELAVRAADLSETAPQVAVRSEMSTPSGSAPGWCGTIVTHVTKTNMSRSSSTEPSSTSSSSRSSPDFSKTSSAIRILEGHVVSLPAGSRVLGIGACGFLAPEVRVRVLSGAEAGDAWGLAQPVQAKPDRSYTNTSGQQAPHRKEGSRPHRNQRGSARGGRESWQEHGGDNGERRYGLPSGRSIIRCTVGKRRGVAASVKGVEGTACVDAVCGRIMAGCCSGQRWRSARIRHPGARRTVRGITRRAWCTGAAWPPGCCARPRWPGSWAWTAARSTVR